MENKTKQRGGAKFKKVPENGQVALLEAVWNMLGGPKAVADKLGVHRQSPVNWRNRGKVPVKYAHVLASMFSLPVWGFNYCDCVFMHSNAPKWEEVVKDYGLPKGLVQDILRRGRPEC